MRIRRDKTTAKAEEGVIPSRARRRRRWCLLSAAAAGAALLVSMLAGGCASPVEGLWPPKPGERTHRILVSTDAWHSVIGIFPEDDPRGRDLSRLEEWGYAEKGYYLEGDTGCSGTLRALLVPSRGVVLVTRAGRPWARRTSQPPGRCWTFELTEEGYHRLRRYLETERASTTPYLVEGEVTWYLAIRDYHLFHHCHHFTAAALRTAGLPVWSSYAIFKWSLEAQLERATKFVTHGKGSEANIPCGTKGDLNRATGTRAPWTPEPNKKEKHP